MDNKKLTINYKYLVDNLRYPTASAKGIIRQAKIKMVELGYPMYNNKKIGYVPVFIVEEIIGFKLLEKER